jgi:hypothetical protein
VGLGLAVSDGVAEEVGVLMPAVLVAVSVGVELVVGVSVELAVNVAELVGL